MDNTFRIHSLSEFHSLCNLPQPEHPLISLIDYSLVEYPFEENHISWIQDFYSIGLKRNVTAKFNYGQQVYDFNKGLLSFISPLQFLRLEIDQEAKVQPSGWLLLIHPDFLWNTALAKKIKSFDFFGYAANEALFLSDKEERAIEHILLNIEQEYQNHIDRFSQELIVNQVERLLIYAERYYERQFITRKKSNFELLDKFEQILQRYFDHGKGLEEGIPKVTAIAEELHISPNYLGTLLRIHTQQNTQEHIQNKMIGYAKERLSTTRMTIGEVAYELGFEYPQSFSKLFKQKTQLSPSEFRKNFN
ncbi:helix-turn-helix transcriptional regulator [Muricauda oceani]|uniref:Helix-turn-helix transcriptional regulator n=1 Tax=Flagellimonas oceani TaxID=2698672 RepID=A0A6G7IYZ4_9FLAO|nr:helix-turn-helix transcriptional regulator [Allomuricauda oceani]MBW8244897.1 helix-turn-helix transcriptional regulator [Allomuricauda oceani]QII43558.1 helix-turn-helix transcriptional regulator [Allomuricauda oceani]